MQKILRRLAAVVLASAGAMASAAPAKGMLLPDDVVPEAYRIAITPHVAEASFDGSVDIDVQVLRATSRIVLDSADLALARVVLDDEAEPPTVALEPKRQHAIFTFAREIAPGRHTLHIAYAGKINDQAFGLFKLQHATPTGPATSLFTMFEDSDARRFVPGWDEPERRATFDLTVTVPAGLMAVGNMPAASTEALPGDLKRVHFATTPRMSTYLLFFGLGDFERVHRDVAGVDVGVVVKRGDAAQAGYALDASAKLLPYYNDWFGTPYPLPKLDMVAGAGESVSFGAMENWGAIFYFERDLLVDAGRATEDDRHRVFETVAHEMAHQWFGNLVTMAWWDDLWLNEGFATWMQVKASQAVHPEWQGWPERDAGKQHALDVDARTGTHPVIMHIDDLSQVEGSFDAITYGKGAQVVRTLEAYAGEDAFRDGVRRYIARHAYGNTVTDDLWRALDEHAERPVGAIARDLTLQAGVPLIVERDARCVDGSTQVTLAQERFAIDPPRTGRWHAPVRLAVLGGGSATTIVDGPAPQAATVPGCGPLVINAGQSSYLRVRYTDAGLAALAAAFDRLGVDDQLGLLGDTQALALAGRLPMGTWLGLLRRVPPQADAQVLQTLARQLVFLDVLHDGLPAQAAFRQFARAQLAPVFARVGWQGAAGESGAVTTLRARLVEALGRFDDAAVVAEASRRFRLSLADPANAQGELRDALLNVVARQADAATWEALHKLARAAPSEVQKSDLYQALGLARDPAVADRALALAISGEPPATVAGTLLAVVAGEHPATTLDFVTARWARVEPLFGSGAAAKVATSFFGNAADRAMLARLDGFVAAHVPAGTRVSVVRASALIRYRAVLREQRLPEADRWIAGATAM